MYCSSVGAAVVGPIAARHCTPIRYCCSCVDLESKEAVEGYVDQVLGRKAFGAVLEDFSRMQKLQSQQM